MSQREDIPVRPVSRTQPNAEVQSLSTPRSYSRDYSRRDMNRGTLS